MNQCTCGLPEAWRDVAGDSRYQVSDHGRFRTKVTGRIRKLQTAHRGGYAQITVGFADLAPASGTN